MSKAAAHAMAPQLKERILADLGQSTFRPAWWLRNGHMQTAWGAAARRQRHHPYRKERWPTPDDDFLDLYFLDGDGDKPLALLLHGLEGNAQTRYMDGMTHQLHCHGWNVAVLEFRTCGSEMNRAPRTYHVGETSDLSFVVNELTTRRPNTPLYLAGVSLGGNVTLKWLGEQGESAPKSVRGAVAISAPTDLTVSAPHIDTLLGGIYVKYFLPSLIAKATQKAEQYPGLLNMEKIQACKSFREYDNLVTAVLHGFDDAEDYWAKSSSGPLLQQIQRPTLLITSADDPFNPEATLPREAADQNPFLIPQFTVRGGHVGFVMGASPLQARYWAEEQMMRFFLSVQDHGP